MAIVDSLSRQCASIVQSVIPDTDSNKVENKLLNGAVYMQTIGDSIETATVRCLSTLAQWENLSDSAANAVPVTVTFETETYTGLITGRPSFSLFNKGSRITRFYEINFQMYI